MRHAHTRTRLRRSAQTPSAQTMHARARPSRFACPRTRARVRARLRFHPPGAPPNTLAHARTHAHARSLVRCSPLGINPPAATTPNPANHARASACARAPKHIRTRPSTRTHAYAHPPARALNLPPTLPAHIPPITALPNPATSHAKKAHAHACTRTRTRTRTRTCACASPPKAPPPKPMHAALAHPGSRAR